MKSAILPSLIVVAVLCGSSPAAVRHVPGEYATIQTAITACNDGDVVVVEPGTYLERIDFSGKDITVTSTDPNNPAVVAGTIINARGVGSAVKFINGETRDAVLSGFTITGGYGTNYLQDGLFWGGGVFCAESSPTITRNVIANNNGPASGGSNAVSYGGGIGCFMSDAVIRNNIIADNTAAAGAGVIIYVGNAKITDNLIYGNSGVIGGGVVLLGGELINNTIVGNDVSLPSDLGGPIAGNVYAASDDASLMYQARVVNNIICGAKSGGGLLYLSLAEDAIAFNDVWDNTPANYIMRDPVTYDYIYGGPADKTGSYGNISRNPLFVNSGQNDYHLLPESPCITAGDPAFAAAPGQTDMDGDPRVYAVRVDIGADEYIGYVRPVADAGADVHIAAPGPVTLDGSGSFFYDPCGVKLYSWEQQSGAPVMLSDPEAAKPTFMAESYGEYRFELVVSDDEYDSEPDEVVVMVGNEPPVADAGPSKAVNAPSRVTLDGTGSYDPDPIDVLAYAWRQLEGPPATLKDADTATPYFDCTEEGLYVFELIVSDGMAQSEPDVVRIATVSATMNQETLDVISGIDGLFHYPDVSGNKVVYGVGSGEDYSWDIFCRDIETGKAASFAGGGIDTQPKIDGNIVVWSGGPRPGSLGWPLRNTSIFVRDIAANVQTTLRPYDESESYSHPAVCGRKVVWLEHLDAYVEEEAEWRDTPYHIYGADITDLNSPVYFPIAYNAGHRDPYPIDDPVADFDSVIDISGNTVVWEGNGDIYGADISDIGDIRIFVICDDPARQYDPAVSGNMVVWTDERNDSGDIYGADISDPDNIREMVVVKGRGSQQQPAIDGRVVVYVEGSVYGGQIKAVCLTKRYGMLDIGLLNNPYGVGPAIDGGVIVWQNGTYGYAQAISLDVGYSISDGPVQNTTTGKRYDYIQHAINAAAAGDHIVADKGVYQESIDFKGKGVKVSSRDPGDRAVVARTIIRGAGSAVTFTSGETGACVVAGFTIEGSERGVYCYGASPAITNCIIAECGGPGMELFKSSRPEIANCRIAGNGGCGIRNWTYPGPRGPLYTCPTITSCVIAENQQEGIFGGIPTINNCTIVGNLANGVNSYRLTVTNSIIYYNGEDSDGPQIISSKATVTYSNIEGSWPGLGNIDADPCFADLGHWDPNGTPDDLEDDFWVDSDCHLKSRGWRWDTGRKIWTWDTVTSRCIDAGNPGSPLGDEPRSIPVDPTCYWGRNLRVNMGAYGGTSEASIAPHGSALQADLTNDGAVNWRDFACAAPNQPAIVGRHPGDLNRDGVTNSADIALFADDWLKQTTWCE
jgi:beta propeller repeat protein